MNKTSDKIYINNRLGEIFQGIRYFPNTSEITLIN